jgi:hypothetical protein
MTTDARKSLAELPPRDWSAAATELERDGVVMLKGALTAGALAKVEAAVEWSLATPAPSWAGTTVSWPGGWRPCPGVSRPGLSPS